MKRPRPKKCKVCKVKFQPERQFQEACDHVCAIKLVVIKREKKEKKKNAEQDRKFYENNLKTRRKYAVKWCNKYIRLRDKDLPCISCGTAKSGTKWDAGHYIQAGNCTALKFNELNINKQCGWYCNHQLSGNIKGYREGLIRKYGQEVVNFLEGPQPTIKITVDFYKEIEEKYKLKIKELESKGD